MQVLKTIPGVPAIAEIIDSVYRVNVMSIDFIAGTVSFTVTSSYQEYHLNNPSAAPVSRIVSFAEIAPLLSPTDIPGFITVIRQALALAMDVPIIKVPEDIFAA